MNKRVLLHLIIRLLNKKGISERLFNAAYLSIFFVFALNHWTIVINTGSFVDFFFKKPLLKNDPHSWSFSDL